NYRNQKQATCNDGSEKFSTSPIHDRSPATRSAHRSAGPHPASRSSMRPRADTARFAENSAPRDELFPERPRMGRRRRWQHQRRVSRFAPCKLGAGGRPAIEAHALELPCDAADAIDFAVLGVANRPIEAAAALARDDDV